MNPIFVTLPLCVLFTWLAVTSWVEVFARNKKPVAKGPSAPSSSTSCSPFYAIRHMEDTSAWCVCKGEGNPVEKVVLFTDKEKAFLFQREQKLDEWTEIVEVHNPDKLPFLEYTVL